MNTAIKDLIQQIKKKNFDGDIRLTYTLPEQQKQVKIGETWSFELVNSDSYDNAGLRKIQLRYKQGMDGGYTKVYPLPVENLSEAIELLTEIFREFGDPTVPFDTSKIDTRGVDDSKPVFVVIIIHDEYQMS